MSTKEKRTVKISQENAVLLLESLILRERLDYEKWDLRLMKSNIATMKKVAAGAQWNDPEKSLVEGLSTSLDELIVIIQEKDTTRVIAGHTHLEQALRAIRNSTFGL